ncbi:MAG: hypothetical protein WC418_06645, partial [Candidatus Omnitrophota bacterium]
MFFLSVAYAEDMTVTTYYPSPNGSYDALSVKRLSVGDTNADGSINASDVSASSGYLLVADKVGIGTTSPAERLTVNGLIKIPSASSSDNNSPGIVVISDDDFLYDGEYINHYGFGFHAYNDGSGYAGINAYAAGYYGIDMFTGGTERLRISSGGNVGIGTVAPGTRLHVYGNGGWNAGFRTEYNGGGGNGWNIVDGTDNNLYIGYGSSSAPSAKVVLQNGGNVGIGTASPGAKLDVYATATTWGGWYEAIRLSQSAHSAITHPGGGLLFGLHGNRNFYWADTTNSWYAMILNANGALTIRGAASLAGDLTVTNGMFRSGTRSNFVLALQGDRNMVLYDNGGAVWASGTSTSDIRLKKNVKDIGKG